MIKGRGHIDCGVDIVMTDRSAWLESSAQLDSSRQEGRIALLGSSPEILNDPDLKSLRVAQASNAGIEEIVSRPAEYSSVMYGFAAVDLVVGVDHNPVPGERVDGRVIGLRPGGSVPNTACALASAGHDVTLVAPVGEDATGDWLEEYFQGMGVNTNLVRMPGVPTPKALVTITENGERHIVGMADNRPFPPQWRTAVRPDDVAKANCIYIQGSLEGVPDVVEQLNRSEGIIVAVPPDELTPGLRTDVVLGSESEFGADWQGRDPLEVASAKTHHDTRYVIMTLGSKGVVAFGRDGETVRVAAHPVEDVVDTTGAGDAAAAGFVHHLVRRESTITDALEAGAQWGAKAVQTESSVPPPYSVVFPRI